MDELYELHAEMCKVFTSPKRLELLNALRDRELSVSELAVKTHLRQSNLSQHLGILRENDIVKTRREGVAIYYSLANSKIIKAFDIIREMLLEKLSRTEKLTRQAKGSKKRRDER